MQVVIEKKNLSAIGKPSFIDVYLRYRFDLGSIAYIAEVGEGILYKMLSYQPVKEQEAKRVLSALSQILDRECTLNDIDIPIDEGIKDGSEQANI